MNRQALTSKAHATPTTKDNSSCARWQGPAKEPDGRVAALLEYLAHRPALVRQRPGQGHRHLLTKRQLYQFIDLLPDWEELSLGLKAVLLRRPNA